MPPVSDDQIGDRSADWRKIDNTNSRHLELYTILGEYDNTGFPLSYCLLTTATSVEDGKRTRALEAWATILRNEYGVCPRFVHTDKDMAEIGASRQVWPDAKHQLCWWHQREAIRKRIKGNLPTSAYNPQRANREHAFLDINFKPTSRVDLNDTEGNVPGEICEQGVQGRNANTTALTSDDPNSIKIRLPALHLTRSSQTIPTVGTSVVGSTLDVTANSAMDTRDNISGSILTCSRRDSSVAGTFSAADNTMKLTIRIPAPSTIRHSGTENESDADDETTNGRRTFCPVEHRDAVVQIMEQHFCAHPLIPGYSAPTPEGIKAWAVKQIYEFCTLRDLPNLWAYLWENWYRRRRWELWACSGNPEEIPCLKTTMLVEAQ
jgi:hypothetical protein